MAKETAEQKLLKLIESTDSKDAAVAPPPRPASYPGVNEAKKALESVQGVAVPKIAVPEFVQNLIVFVQNPKLLLNLGLKEINNILLFFIIIFVIFFTLEFSSGLRMSGHEILFESPLSVSAMAENIFPTFKDLAKYINVVSRRNIFHPYERKKVQEALRVPKEFEGIKMVSQQAKDLRLVGISWLDSAESATAMIEHAGSGITHFLRSGDRINDVLIKSIFMDSIIVTYKGEEMEIKL